MSARRRPRRLCGHAARLHGRRRQLGLIWATPVGGPAVADRAVAL